MKRPILLLLITFLFHSLVAQSSIGVLRVQVTPNSAWVKVDTVLVKPSKDIFQPYRFNLNPGIHRIEMWAPGFKKVTDSIVIEANKAKDYQFGFKYGMLDPEFVAYRKEYKRYSINNFSRKATVGAGAVATLGLILYTFSNPAVNQYKELTLDAKERYLNSVATQDFLTNKESYERYAALYVEAQKERNLKYIVGIPVALTAGGITYWLYTKFRKKPLVKPEFTDKNPFVFRPLIEPGTGDLCIGFHLNF
ncbi:MAG: hypothetical protein HUU01_23230 [Saprospiraceae bacterium]|nr:hypothetical protein [Saprospiraceae bacterium]